MIPTEILARFVLMMTVNGLPVMPADYMTVPGTMPLLILAAMPKVQAIRAA